MQLRTIETDQTDSDQTALRFNTSGWRQVLLMRREGRPEKGVWGGVVRKWAQGGKRDPGLSLWRMRAEVGSSPRVLGAPEGFYRGE